MTPTLEKSSDKILELTGCQPYLLQLIGQKLVTHFNQETFEVGNNLDKVLSLETLNAVIESREFFQDGGAYLTGIWAQGRSPYNQTS